MSNDQPNNSQLEPAFEPGQPVIYLFRGVPVNATVKAKRRVAGRAELQVTFAVDGNGTLTDRWVWQSKCRAAGKGEA